VPELVPEEEESKNINADMKSLDPVEMFVSANIAKIWKKMSALLRYCILPVGELGLTCGENRPVQGS